jgi:glycine cleavage system aminomethyltransferase T
MSGNVGHIPFTIIGPRVRKSPFFASTRKYGCKAYSVYNHMYMPLYYDDPISEYQNLIEHVCLWDVACERQVEITGPDAYRLSQYLTTRDVSKCGIGQCMYAPLVDERGGLLNDPVMLRLEDNKFWFSLADSDILLWVKGIALNSHYDVEIKEPFVSPVAIQGPKANDLAVDLFGEWVRDLKFFRCRETELSDIPLVVARSGWSKQGGFELYLQDSSRGNELWEIIMEAGEQYNIIPGAPSAIERIESGLLSYGSDMDMTNNPFEVDLDQYVSLDQEDDFIGKAALKDIVNNGLTRKLVGIEFDERGVSNNENRWPVFNRDILCGTVRSATYSHRLGKNIALAMLAIESSEIGTVLSVETPVSNVEARVTSVPFK